MNAAVILPDRLRNQIEEARAHYREAYGTDTGITGLLEAALVNYKGILRDVIDHNRQKARSVTGVRHDGQVSNSKTLSTGIDP